MDSQGPSDSDKLKKYYSVVHTKYKRKEIQTE